MDLLAPLRRVCDDPWSVVSMPELSGMASWWLRGMIVQTGWSNLPSQGETTITGNALWQQRGQAIHGQRAWIDPFRCRSMHLCILA